MLLYEEFADHLLDAIKCYFNAVILRGSQWPVCYIDHDSADIVS